MFAPPFEWGIMWSNSSLSLLPQVTHLPSSRLQTAFLTRSGIGSRAVFEKAPEVGVPGDSALDISFFPQ